jgi:predicted nuclease with TOPRIM domain
MNMKQVKTRIKEFHKELSSIHNYYISNGIWSGDVYELKEEFEKLFQNELNSGVKTKNNNSTTTLNSL